MINYFLALLFGIFAFSLANANSVICEGPLRAGSFREEVLQSSLRDIASREKAWVSSLNSESPELGVEIPSQGTPHDHVISLASGPDVFRPLYLFPFAGHIHLVDLGNGWMKGFTNLFRELEARLHSLGPNAKVERLQNGFLRYRPEPSFTGDQKIRGVTLSIPGPWKRKGNQWDFYRRPCVWKIRWESVGHGPQQRFVYLHVGDYSNVRFAESVIKRTKDNLVGLFISGVGLPGHPILDMYVDRLRTDGLFVAELEHTHLSGKPFGTPQDIEREDWLKNQMTVVQRLPISMSMIQTDPTKFWPTFYVLKKPK